MLISTLVRALTEPRDRVPAVFNHETTPRDLQELRIEEPGGEPDSLDGVDENKSE